ncbi:uncharacterized protein EI97DRAFT_480032 [Westerdykella ornata]|uniref:Uncharacterized protein n=1 Tax=Westerdykella ornata TaxID=318751 RepID=A0A6A6JDY0_WESOR|nr:uncharacterized protein EI97DRAFT_480032 [Westerdykella ornata]KAF2273856.1 hypothetical protein EI97DRAFT_480032 [Westerdykella ornata]
MEYSHLNTAQSRVHAMKADLQNFDTDHLQSFLDGISDPEPPDYRKVNGKVVPSLQKVTLKESANKYHIGNVLFTVELPNEVQDVSLLVQKGEVDVFMDDPIPKDPNNPLSYPILDSIFMDLIPLWGAKYKAIKQRMVQINDVRAYAHNAPNQPEPRLSYGTNLTKLIDSSPSSPNSPHSRKRSSGEPVPKHPANKRARVGLASIPDSVKATFFSKIPDHFKIELFNSIARSVFPSFDNLIMASWNLVSLYEHVGSEFGALHTAIVELKAVLTEIDAAWRKESRNGNGAQSEEAAVKEEPLVASEETSSLTTSAANGDGPCIQETEAQEIHDDSEVVQEAPQTPVRTGNMAVIQLGHMLHTPMTKSANDGSSLFVSPLSTASSHRVTLFGNVIGKEVTIEGTMENTASRKPDTRASHTQRELLEEYSSNYQNEVALLGREFHTNAKGVDPEEEARLRDEYVARVKDLRQQLKEMKKPTKSQTQDERREKKPSPSQLVRSFHHGKRESGDRDGDRNTRANPQSNRPQYFSDDDFYEHELGRYDHKRGGREMSRMPTVAHHSPKLGNSLLGRRK